MSKPLQHYEVTYVDPECPELLQFFLCQAEDDEHAKEQCLDSEPTADLIDWKTILYGCKG